MPDIFAPYLQQLFSRSPTIVACLVGMIVAVSYWKRCPRSALFVCLAMGLFLFTSFVMPLVHLYLIFQGPDALGFRWMIPTFTFAWSVVNAIGMVLLVAAAFTGRSHPALRRFMEDDDYPPITGAPRDTGIKSYGHDRD